MSIPPAELDPPQRSTRPDRPMAPIPEATWENRPDAALICFVTYTRARGALLRDQTDLLEPPGRRCGC